MSRCIQPFSFFVALSCAMAWGGDPKAGKQPVPSKPDRSYGTAIEWESDLEVAAKKANRERKLLMVLAVAGHFEDPFFT